MNTLVVVEDDPDAQFLVRALFSLDPRFSITGMAASAEEALEMTRDSEPEIIVLDHGLAGTLTGIEAVPHFKRLAPRAKVIMFTAHHEMRDVAEAELGIDAFVPKTSAGRLLTVAQRMASIGPLYT